LVCLVLLSTAALLMAFVSEPALGLRGEAGGVFSGLLALFAGAMTHLVASVTR
jgi:hypothetical protein